MARKSLDAWIQEALTDSDKDGEVSMMMLVHQVGQQEREIHTTKFAASKKWKSSDLAKMFMGKAETHAQDLPGYQTFCLKVFYGGRSQEEAVLPFGVRGKTDHDGATEAPTPEGRTMQSMRHGEALFGQTYRRQQQQDDYAIRLLEVQNRMLVTAMQENRDMFSIFKEVMLQQATNQHQHRMEELQFQRGSEDRKKLLQYLPILANTIMGREVFPQSTEDTALVEGVLDQLTADDAQVIASMLKPELQGPFMHRIEKHIKKRDAENVSRKALAKSLNTSTAESELEITEQKAAE